MAAKIIGNRRGRGGVGVQNLPMANVDWVAVIGQAGDVAFVGCSGFNSHPTHLSYSVQGDGKATASVQLTLANEASATSADPDVQAGVPWDSTAVPDVAADTKITPLVVNGVSVGFTALKVTFTAPGTIYIFGR